MSGPRFDIFIGTPADLSGLVKSASLMNDNRAALEAVNRLNTALAQREYDRLSALEKINRLKQQESELAAKAVDLENAGNKGGAAQLNLAILKRREEIERLVAQLQREQAVAAREAAQAQERAATAAQKRAADLERANAANAQTQAKITADLERQAEASRKVAEETARTAAAAKEREQAAVNNLNEALGRRGFEKLSDQGKINFLKKEEAELIRKAVEQESAGNRGGAAQLNLAVLQKREQIERLVTAEKEKQAMLDRQNARFQLQLADTLQRYRNQRLADELKRSQGIAPRLAGAGLDRMQAFANALPAQLGGPLSSLLGTLSRLAPLLGGAAGMAGLAAAPLAAAGIVKYSVGQAGVIKDQAEQSDLRPEEVQRLTKVGRASGIEFNDFAVALGNISAQRRAAAEGNEEMRATFARFGVTLEQLNDPAVRHIDLLGRIAAKSRDATQAERTMLRDLLGKRGEKFGSALGGLDDVGKTVVSDESIARLDEYGKRWQGFFGDMKVWLMEASASWIKFGDSLATIFSGNYGGKTPGMSAEQRDYRGFRLDRAAIERGDMRPEEASEQFKDYDAFLRNKVSKRMEAEELGREAAAAEAQGYTEEAKAIRQRSRDVGRESEVGYDKFQAERAKARDGALFEDKKKQAELTELTKSNAEKALALEMSLLSVEERRARLNKEIAALKLGLDQMPAGLEKARIEKGLLDKRAALQQLEKNPANDQVQTLGGHAIQSNDLRQIGGFTTAGARDNGFSNDLALIRSRLELNSKTWSDIQLTLMSGAKVRIVD